MTGDFFSRWASGLLDQFIHGGIKTGIPEIDSLVTLMATLFTSGSYLVNSTSSLFSSLGYTPISWSDQNVVAVPDRGARPLAAAVGVNPDRVRSQGPREAHGEPIDAMAAACVPERRVPGLSP